ncbi:MAG TPA: hypothetical protein VLC98_07725 [Phnomibacter sp.]|nr:hypothetical protein [Phnomibacter sp.]
MKYALFIGWLLWPFFLVAQKNVGIGTATPTAPLHIKSTGSELLKIEGANPYIGLYDNTEGYRGYLWYSNSIELGSAYGSNLPVTIAPGNLLSSYFLPNGNVGIGIANPTQKLQVAGNILTTGSVGGSGFTFNAPKTYYYSISGADVVPLVNSTVIDRSVSSGGGFTITGGTTGLLAPLHLPQGAVITKLTVYFYDNATPNLEVSLYRNVPTDILATVVSAGTPGESSMIDNSIINGTINNSLYAYAISFNSIGGFWPDYSMIVRRVVVEYTLLSL